MDHAVTDPFAHARHGAEPAIFLGARGAGDNGGQLLIQALRLGQATLERGLVRDEQRTEIFRSDEH
ncbi:hypothetical protein D3C72_2097540 [compost metagenome]